VCNGMGVENRRWLRDYKCVTVFAMVSRWGMIYESGDSSGGGDGGA
jgi:hypothetical protein